MLSATPRIRRRRARSAMMMLWRRSTAAASSSLTTMKSYSANEATSSRATCKHRCGVCGRGAVEVVEHRRPLEELTRRDHRLEPLPRHEIIVHAVDFGLARGTRGVRPRHSELGNPLDQL